MSESVYVRLGDRSYEIEIGPGSLDGVGRRIRAVAREARKVFLITDDKVDPIYGARVASVLGEVNFEVVRGVVPAGEASKSIGCYGALLEQAAEHALDRRGGGGGGGGGVVGDLAGFVAATYLRGVDFVQVPTTLLSMVDSAVGGKTGINLPQGKNLVGSFYQPRHVVCDLETLGTLPNREFVSGLAEVIKYGVIADARLFAELETRVDSVLARDPVLLGRLVAWSCRIKAEVVGKDEREGGLRAILNFGHTLGHALEKVLAYGEWLHGEAISVGMMFAARLSMGLTGMAEADVVRLEKLLTSAGLPVRAPVCSWEEVRSAMDVDKKAKGGRPTFVLAEGIGKVRFGVEVGEDALAEAWAAVGGG